MKHRARSRKNGGNLEKRRGFPWHRSCFKARQVAEKVKNDLDAFKENVPLLHALCNPGLRERHWAEISNVIGFEMGPDPTLTLNKDLLQLLYT